MPDRINVGLIGAGMWGRVHLGHLAKAATARTTWVCSRTEASVAKAREAYGIPRGTLDYREVLADPGVEAVVIATPPATHAEMAVAALRAGKHVLLEKPMATSHAEVEAILAEAARHPELALLDCSCRTSRLQPKFDLVREMIAAGRLGRVYHIFHRHLVPTTFLEYNPKARWAMADEAPGCGSLLDLGVYDLSFHLGVLGDPALRELRAFKISGLRAMETGGDFKPGVEQHASAYMTLEGGVTYYYERGYGVFGETANETRIFGTKGGLRLSYPTWEAWSVEWRHAGPDGREAPRREELAVDTAGFPEHDNILLLEHFCACVRGKAGPIMPPALAAKHLEILLRIPEKAR